MAALRCSTCRIDWPNQAVYYTQCPQCEQPTTFMFDAEPISFDEARRLTGQARLDQSPRDRASETREKYDEYWAKQPQGTPRLDPRGPYHSGHRHWHAFEELCRLADARKVTVGLRVTADLVVKASGEERRDLYELTLTASGKQVATEPIANGHLNRAAMALQPMLAARGSGWTQSA